MPRSRIEIRSRHVDTRHMRRLLLVLAISLAAFAPAAAAPAASAQPSASWAALQIAVVVDAGLMAPSVASFRPDEPLTRVELATALASLGGSVAVDDPSALVTLKELDAHLVALLGLRPDARKVRESAGAAGLATRPWLGTETVARLLGLRINHPRSQEQLELQLSQPVTRAEAAYSIARVLGLSTDDIDAVRKATASFTLPPLDDWQRVVLERALRFVGSPYVWAGTSERPQRLGAGQLYPGGFDCSGLVWRVFKLQPIAGAAKLSSVLRGRTTYEMSGEVPVAKRIPLDELEPGDVVFFGTRGARSKPSEVGHMGIYAGNGWMVHSSTYGTTLTPMTGWYQKMFAWARRPLAEAGLRSGVLQVAQGGSRPSSSA